MSSIDNARQFGPILALRQAEDSISPDGPPLNSNLDSSDLSSYSHLSNGVQYDSYNDPMLGSIPDLWLNGVVNSVPGTNGGDGNMELACALQPSVSQESTSVTPQALSLSILDSSQLDPATQSSVPCPESHRSTGKRASVKLEKWQRFVLRRMHRPKHKKKLMAAIRDELKENFGIKLSASAFSKRLTRIKARLIPKHRLIKAYKNLKSEIKKGLKDLELGEDQIKSELGAEQAAELMVEISDLIKERVYTLLQDTAALVQSTRESREPNSK